MPSDESTARRWLQQLEQKLRARNRVIKTTDDYYEGRHKLTFQSERFKKIFGGLFDEFADNWCELVVDAAEERLNITGFRFGDSPDADEMAARIWQTNQLDAQSHLAHTEALIAGESAVMVWPSTTESGIATITVEHPTQVFVATDSANPMQRLAALKMWTDEWTGDHFSTVYLNDTIWKFQQSALRASAAEASTPAASMRAVRREFGPTLASNWQRREVEGEKWPLPNPVEVVPIVPLVNRPRMLKAGVSEIRNVIPVQNLVNKLIADMVVSSELGAMPARWATGYQLESDPETGEILEPKLTDYLNKLFINEDEKGQFGQFRQADLGGFVKTIEMGIQHIASQSRTPPHYFYLRGEFPSGESIKSAETGLVAKVRRKQRPFGETWEEVMRLAFAASGDSDKAEVVEAETIWSDPESRSESEHIDALMKLKSLGVPLAQLWEDAGYTPQQVARFEAMHAKEQLLGLTAADEIDALLAGPAIDAPDAE